MTALLTAQKYPTRRNASVFLVIVFHVRMESNTKLNQSHFDPPKHNQMKCTETRMVAKKLASQILFNTDVNVVNAAL